MTKRTVIALLVLVAGCNTTTIEAPVDGGPRDSAIPGDGSYVPGDGSLLPGDATLADGGTVPGTDAAIEPGTDAGTPGIDAGGADATPGGDPMPGARRFVAVGYGGHRTMSLDGQVWEHHIVEDPEGGDDPSLLRGVGYGGGLFVAVGNRIMTSTDGIEWTTVVPDTGAFLTDAVYDDGVWVAAGGNGLRVRSDDGGHTWDLDSPYAAGHFRGIAAGDGIVVAVGHTYDGAGLRSTSHDGGLTWRDATGGQAYAQVEHGDGVFVAVGDGGRVSVSTDGDTWTETRLGSGRLDDVSFVDGELFARGGGSYWTSRDGNTWTSGSGSVPEGVVTDGVTYVGFSWSVPILSADAANGPWSTADPTRPAITDVAVSD